MRTSWRRKEPIGSTILSWSEAYRSTVDKAGYTVDCLYEDVSPGQGVDIEEAKDDFLDNIRSRITELTEMLEYCAKNNPKRVASQEDSFKMQSSFTLTPEQRNAWVRGNWENTNE